MRHSPPRPLTALCLVLALAGCGSDGAREAGGVTPGEAEALEDAASMLDEQRLPPDALPPEPGATPAPAEMTGDAADPAD